MKLTIQCFLLALLFSTNLYSQELSALVKDSRSNKPIEFATVAFQENRGVVTNEEGFFKIPDVSNVTEISISSIGYVTKTIKLEEVEAVIHLEPSTIELSGVFISNSNMEAKEIIEKVLENVDRNYDSGLRKKRFFLRKSYLDKVNEFKLDIEESTVEGIDQDFMNSIIKQIPNNIDSYLEYFGDYYGDYKEQKVQLLKVANLENPINEESVDQIVERFEKILQENVKEGTFLKVKSGIVGFKMDAEELNEGISENKAFRDPEEKTQEELEKEEERRRKSYQSGAQNFIGNLMDNMFWKEDITLDVFEKSRKYEFSIEGFIEIQNSIAYIVAFEPKRGADFKGKIYVDSEDFGIYRMEYENVNVLKSFSLFGVSSQDDLYKGKLFFNKDENGKYAPRFIELQVGDRVKVDRPLSLLVKEEGFIFKKKLQEVDLEFKIDNSSMSKVELVIYDDEPLEKSRFGNLTIKDDFEYKTFKKYDPAYWSDFNIIEPNTAIKEFISINEQ